ncbi:hypothetical protein EDD85DRAFT_798800 [Armillaria nabsnona]|nr:hypothetical protein EDD85DRAFT_798800 [Armillaria nabsnona]
MSPSRPSTKIPYLHIWDLERRIGFYQDVGDFTWEGRGRHTSISGQIKAASQHSQTSATQGKASLRVPSLVIVFIAGRVGNSSGSPFIEHGRRRLSWFLVAYDNSQMAQNDKLRNALIKGISLYVIWTRRSDVLTKSLVRRRGAERKGLICSHDTDPSSDTTDLSSRTNLVRKQDRTRLLGVCPAHKFAIINMVLNLSGRIRTRGVLLGLSAQARYLADPWMPHREKSGCPMRSEINLDDVCGRWSIWKHCAGGSDEETQKSKSRVSSKDASRRTGSSHGGDALDSQLPSPTVTFGNDQRKNTMSNLILFTAHRILWQGHAQTKAERDSPPDDLRAGDEGLFAALLLHSSWRLEDAKEEVTANEW